MSRPELVVPVADLDRGPKQVEFALSEGWLRHALAGTDASVQKPGKLAVTLSKNGQDVLVRGEISADLTLPCVVTLDPVPVEVRTELLLMLSPRSPGSPASPQRRPSRDGGSAEPTAGAGRERPQGVKGARSRERGAVKEGGKGRGTGGRWEDTPILSDEEAGQDTYDGHEIVLDDFVREFLILELPMFPRRSDLPTDSPAANPPLPAGNQPEGPKPLDPRLSPLADLKSRLEKMKKE